VPSLDADLHAFRETLSATLSQRTAILLPVSIESVGASSRDGLGVAGRLLHRTVRRLFGGAVTGAGVVDFTERRYSVDYGGYAEVFAESRRMAGPSGMEPSPVAPPEGPTPLWLFDALTGAIAVRQDAERTNKSPLSDLAVAGSRTHNVVVDLRLAHAVAKGFFLPRSLEVGETLSVLTLTCRSLLTGIDLTVDGQRWVMGVQAHGVALECFNWSVLPDRTAIEVMARGAAQR